MSNLSEVKKCPVYEDSIVQAPLGFDIYERLQNLISNVWVKGEIWAVNGSFSAVHQQPAWITVYETRRVGEEKLETDRGTYFNGVYRDFPIGYRPAIEVHKISIGLALPDGPRHIRLPKNAARKLRANEYLIVCDSFNVLHEDINDPQQSSARIQYNSPDVKNTTPAYRYFLTITPDEYPGKLDYFLERDTKERSARGLLSFYDK